jgi:hypothetical protein
VVNDKVLDHPVMVIALEGWIDAGLGASAAVASLLEGASAETLVAFDGEHFLDQRARRPVARFVDGITAGLTWPHTELRAASDLQGSPMLYLVGPEPDFHWRQFVDAVVSLAQRHGVRLTVGLGSFPAPAPHTRPVRLAATAPVSSSELARRIGVVHGELEVPAGMLSALELGFESVGIPAVSLWARVPHYVAAVPFPEASAALIEGLAAISGLALDAVPLRRAADSSRRQVDELISANPQHLAMVRRLEAAVDESEGNALGMTEMPTGDEIAAELERFLRGEGGA